MKTICIWFFALLYLPIALLSNPIKTETIKPLSVLIIGGGPAGLATAIEAKKTGAIVTIVEKRNNYSRPQHLFFFDSSLKLLQQWNVVVPQMQVAELGDGTQIGFVTINHLEESLESRAKDLGIQKISGEFKQLTSNHTAIVLTSKLQQLDIPYDIIVGADGAHSLVREILNIQMNDLGSAIGTLAFVLDPSDTSVDVDISPPIRKEAGFLQRIKAPSVSILCMQSPINSSKDALQKLLVDCGWKKEAFLIGENKAFVIADIPITLQQAQTFSCQEKSAILVGDATATASFLRGTGANTALETVKRAGDFFQELQKENPAAYQNFNQAIKEVTDAMIADSAFLF